MLLQAAEVARRLAQNAEAVCRHYLSNGRREGRSEGGRAMTDRLGRADLHIHTLASDGTAGIVEILNRSA